MIKQSFKFLSIFFIFSIYLSSQELDQEFLNSLPKDIAQDIVSLNKEKKDGEKPQYRRPSTFIEKPESEENTKSKRFGANIFSMMQSSMMPINDPNLDGTYILDVGDELEVLLTGQKSYEERLIIKRDGSINIPDVGKIFLSGLSLDNAIELIKAKINISYIGVNVFVSLVNVRDIQVIIAGNVYSPGTYTLNGNSNVFHALTIAGGPSEQGSFRAINLVRGNDVIEEIDLYETFIFGKKSFNTRLRSGDIVFVKPYQNLINIFGAIKRPGMYELKKEESISKAVFYANGYTNYADLGNISLERLEKGESLKIEIPDTSDFEDIIAKDGDNIFIGMYTFREVSILGSVKNPGSYLMKEGDGIYELVMKAGGYNKSAYPFGGILDNLKTKETNIKASKKLYERFLTDLTYQVSNNPGVDVVQLISLVQELRDVNPSGRINAEFDLELLKNDPSLDITLQAGDMVLIPEYLDHVYVYGEISSEGTVKYKEGEDLSYYIKRKGGYAELASQDSLFIVHPNGETIRYDDAKNIFLTKKETLKIYPGSIIYVPRKSNNEFMARQRIQAYTTILGNLGVSLASLAVLKDWW